MLRLSVLDQSPVPSGSSAGDALRNSIDLARRCEAFGFHRYWVAEHHNTGGLAGSAPEILIGHIASATSTMRIGSGGVMMPHYAPLKIAENFRMLASLHPGRIDVGVGRAPGSDPVTMHALAPDHQPVPIQKYPSMVAELDGFLHDSLPADSPFRGRVQATPVPPEPPELWLLASSPDSAAYAAHFGLPLAFADFIAQTDGAPIVDAYRDNYQPSERHPEPRILVAASVICAESHEAAEALAAGVKLWRQRGLQGPIPSPDEVSNHVDGPLAVPPSRKPMIQGNPTTVATNVRSMAARYGAEEFMAVTICWDHEARVRSYELLADQFRR
ncbi:MAG: LLM class flavin-dependent oxidoreductase [Acidimicrobiales bacterium]|nr:LLM class flavin-dependent oxidoreductase [Acidimicrobiales bacterium]